jgi:hypothetical protein
MLGCLSVPLMLHFPMLFVLYLVSRHILQVAMLETTADLQKDGSHSVRKSHVAVGVERMYTVEKLLVDAVV